MTDSEEIERIIKNILSKSELHKIWKINKRKLKLIFNESTLSLQKLKKSLGKEFKQTYNP